MSTEQHQQLSEIDRGLLKRCLAGEDDAWRNFVDRFLGLVLHVVDHAMESQPGADRSRQREDLCARVFSEISRDDFRLLRHYRGQSSLATYLVVVARRIVTSALA